MRNAIDGVERCIRGAASAVKATRERADEALTLCQRKVSSFDTLHGRFDALEKGYDGVLPQIETAYGNDSVDGPWSVATDGQTEVWHGAGLTATDAVTKARDAARRTVAWCERGRQVFGETAGLVLPPVASWLVELEAEAAGRHSVGQDLRRASNMGAVRQIIDGLKLWAEQTVAKAEAHGSAVESFGTSVEKSVGNLPATIRSLRTNVSFVESQFQSLRAACMDVERGARRI